MFGVALNLSSTWIVGTRLDGGGFGQVYELSGGPVVAVAKFVPKQPGADREMLFVGLSDVPNVVPVIDSGEHGDYLVIVMPRADMSLRAYLGQHPGIVDLDDAIGVLMDTAMALVGLEGKGVVHRDLKPENILLLNGRWCLADFGISRYAEASTAPDTHKWSMTPQYAAPERWRSERATISADVYSLGVIAYELLSGRLPFGGPSQQDYREQHLHADAPPIDGVVPVGLATLVDECLFKPPDTRPAPANLLARLKKQQSTPPSGALAALAAANRAEVQRRAEAGRRGSIALTEAEQRAERQKASRVTLARIAATLHEAIMGVASAATSNHGHGGSWSIVLGPATLAFSGSSERRFGWGGWQAPAFDVDAAASLSLKIPPTSAQYEGRSHSLWFGDIQEEGRFAWHEAAFMVSTLIPQRGRQDPFALDPGAQAAKAVWNGMAEYQVAWPFTRLDPDGLDDFVERWANWFADASSGRLAYPSQMPERPAEGSWRR